MVQALEKPLVDELVQHGQLVGAALHHVADDVLEHALGQFHIVLKVGEGNLGLHHPELGGMARRVGVLRAESGAERVHIPEGHGEVLGVQLAGHGERGGLAEEVGAPIHLAGHKRAVRGRGSLLAHERYLGRVDGGHAEHLAGPFAVARRDDGRVHVDEPAILEEAVDGGGGHRADAEHGAEQVRARPQMLLGAQELRRGALLLQRVVGSRGALDANALGGKLEGLRGVRRQLQRAFAHESRRHVLVRNLVVVFQRRTVHDHLQVLEATAVVQRDETEVLHIAD